MDRGNNPEVKPPGLLKIFLGYSSGVGKSYRMLDEGRRRHERGQDVVVGAVQPRTDSAAADILRHLPVVPMQACAGHMIMDVEAILRRQPEICLVDGMAYDNPPQARWRHRWREIDFLLASGISVITSVNLQFIEERQDEVESITGRRSTQTVPLAALLQADEIEVVDAPPDQAGTGIPPWKLSALREIALLLAADVVDRQLESYLLAHGIEARWGTQERILVCITPQTDAKTMIESGRRNADRFRGELIVAHVRPSGLTPMERQRLDANLLRAREAGAEVVVVEGVNFANAILPFARGRGITQIFIGHSSHQRWWRRIGVGRSSLDQLISAADDMDVRIFPH